MNRPEKTAEVFIKNPVAAYVVSAEKISIDELNNFIAERKPPYMVPAVTMQIDKITLNQNSKVNRRALPKPELQTANEDNAKRNDLQKAWKTAEEDPDKAKILTSTIAYRSDDSQVVVFPKNNLYTMQVFYRLGYSWPLTMGEYVEKFVNMLQRVGFFSV